MPEIGNPAGVKAGVSVRVDGPLFKRNAAKILEDESRSMMREVAQTGLDELKRKSHRKEQIKGGVFLNISEARPGRASKGAFRKSLTSRSTSKHTSMYPTGAPARYGTWLEGTSSRNQSSRFKGYSIFRDTQDWLDKVAAKRIGPKYQKRIAARLNGTP